MSRLRTFLASALLGSVLNLTSTASAQLGSIVDQFHLPPDYFSRFGSLQAVVSNTDGYGVRYFPLPFSQDIRLSLVKAPTYVDVGLTTRVNDTTFAIGKFYNVPTFEITRNPGKGVQFSGVLRGDNGFSSFSGGYAFTLAKDRFRILNNVGVAYKGDKAVPYTQSELSTGYGQTFGKVNTYVAATGRYYAFPLQREGQASADFYLAATTALAPGLSVHASHFERFVTGTVAIADYGLGRYESSYLEATYRLPASWPSSTFALGGVRSRVSRDWTNDYTYVYGDLFFKSDLLPTMVGPSIGYRFGPGNAEGVWLISLAALNK
ncbi:hypothetical protein [Deinococcus hohokamensis]|uniref:Uncharacterized protein n=1 Tax=Deinococcus hohokamensis TaxID=309883 RepID=A0ABV9I8J5_9DEIO